MKVYISGPITGLPHGNRAAFYQAAKNLQDIGHEPVNPHTLHGGRMNDTWEGYMRRDIAALMTCDAIVVLDGWRKSRGARIEHRISQLLGIRVFELGLLLVPEQGNI